MTDPDKNEEDPGMQAIHELLSKFISENYPATRREYHEEQELMSHVFRNYPEIVRPHECVGSHEQILDLLPAHLRDEYWQHALECREVVQAAHARAKELSDEGSSVTIMPELPELRPELLEIVSKLQEELEQQLFWEKFQPHQQHVSINRCPACNRIVLNDMTRQCLWCGHTWH